MHNLALLREAHGRRKDSEIHSMNESTLSALRRTGPRAWRGVLHLLPPYCSERGEQALFDGQRCQSDSLPSVQGTGCLCDFVYHIQGVRCFQVNWTIRPFPLSSVSVGLSSHSKLKVVA